jgi:methionyl-tRNA formyltransferase
MFRIVLAGSVKSSLITLEQLVHHEMNVIAVFGYEPKDTSAISGYVSMKEFCDEHKIGYYPFEKINSIDNLSILKELKPDIFFVTGLSQLVSDEMLSVAKIGNVGFHPTCLPKGRGRAPIAWLILEEKFGAANFFLLGSGTDDGPIFVQNVFSVDETDNAATVEQKILTGIKQALNKWLPHLKKGEWNFIPQNEDDASYYGKRSAEDGIINWNSGYGDIDKLIRASSNPHPGAFTFLNTTKIYIWDSKKEKDIKIKGVTGRVLLIKENNFLIQCGEGLLWISNVTDENLKPVALKVGQKLGYYPELEIYNLRKEIQGLKEWIQKITS